MLYKSANMYMNNLFRLPCTMQFDKCHDMEIDFDQFAYEFIFVDDFSI